MSRQTLNIHNDFTGLSLVGFDATEIDLLSAVCHEMQNQGTTKVTIGFEKLRELSQYKGHDNDRLFEDLRSMDTKLAALNFKRSTDDTYMRFTLFPTFTLSRTEQQVTVAVNNSFVYLLNELGSQYTALELMESASLRSRYSKQIYKRLKQYRDTGIWIIGVTDFRDYLDVPKTYRMTQIEERVIKVALKELSPYFDNLRVQKEVRHKTHHRGRPKYDTLVWRFKPQKSISTEKKAATQQKPDSNSLLQNRRRPRSVWRRNRTNRQRTQLQTASSEAVKARRTCQYCGKKAVIELTARSDGHLFWKCESCQKIFKSIAEIKGISETPSRTPQIDHTATKSGDRHILTPQERDTAVRRILNKSSESANAINLGSVSAQHEETGKENADPTLKAQVTTLKQLVNNSKSGEIGIKKLCNKLNLSERQNVMADITPIADAAGYTATVTEHYASDDLKPKTIRFDKK